MSRLLGLPEDSPDFPAKEILDELIGDLPVDESFAEANRRAAKFSKLTTSHDGFADWLEPNAV